MGPPRAEGEALTVLDTDYLVAADRRVPGALTLGEAFLREGASLRIPAAAWAEFLASFAEGRRQRAASELLARAEFHPFGREEADEAADIQHDLIRSGRPMPWHDLQVAATARLLGEDLVSNDLAFRRVPGLSVRTF